MIIVRVELHSAITGKVSEIARMGIANIGGTKQNGNYGCETYRGRDSATLDQRRPQRNGYVNDYPRLRIHVWHLVARALAAMSYIDSTDGPKIPDLVDGMGEDA